MSSDIGASRSLVSLSKTQECLAANLITCNQTLLLAFLEHVQSETRSRSMSLAKMVEQPSCTVLRIDSR